jgi:hypothetical protein
MIKSLLLMTLGVFLFSAKAQSNDTGLPIRNEADRQSRNRIWNG